MASNAERSPDYETIKADIDGLKRQIAELFDHVTKRAANEAGAIYEDISRRGHDSVDAAVDHVRARPLTSILAAVAIGYIVAQLLRR